MIRPYRGDRTKKIPANPDVTELERSGDAATPSARTDSLAKTAKFNKPLTLIIVVLSP